MPSVSLVIYRRLLRLYPPFHRQRFEAEMTTVFDELRAENLSKGLLARGAFYVRETAGVLTGAVREHWQALGGDAVWLWFPNRRYTMRTEFRFPKATAVLMAIILGGVVLAIQKGEAISASLRDAVSPPVGPIHPVHSVLLGGIMIGLAFFYAAGLIGWAIVFAMRRSGIHRLDETSAGPR